MLNLDVDDLLEPGSIFLPSLIFFKPNLRFLAYIKTVMEREKRSGIVDIGAGMGHLSRMLAVEGHKVLAIDIAERENPEFPVVYMNATTFCYPESCLPIVARPSHGSWLDRLYARVLSRCPLLLYVGLPKNFDNDLGGLDDKYAFTFLDWEAGEEGERVVELRKL